jgi:hypothetical protein
MTDLAEAVHARRLVAAPETLPPLPALSRPGRGRGRRSSWDDARREKLERMWKDDVDVVEIAAACQTSRGGVYAKARELGLGRRRKPFNHRGQAKTLVEKGARDGQRRFRGVVDGDGPRIVLQPHHPAHRAGTTFFPGTVQPASVHPRLLKSGEHSRKIGKVADKGEWKGLPLYTLTLEERATCPRTCRLWAECYGNNMPFAHRIFDDGNLTLLLRAEIVKLAAMHPAGFAIRLHVLGDFYSVEYVGFWRRILSDFPTVRIWGFTARRPDDPIGAELLYLTRDEPRRFKMRFSGGGYETHCSEVVDRPEEAKGIVCPAELDENRCCATCGLCWTSDKTISFLRH